MSFGIRRSRVLLLLCLALLDVALPRAVAARRPAASPGAATGASGGSAAARRAPARLRVLFLRVAFPDRPSKRPPEDIQNASRSGLVDRLVGYYDEVSSRRFHIDASVSTRVYTLPRPRAEYVDKTEEMVRDALAAATAPSAERARIARLKPQAVVVFFAGPGEESDMQGTSRADPWSNTVIGTRFDAAGTVVDRATVVGEDPPPPLSPFGVLAHEFGHLLDLPELYAPGRGHEGIGVWGLMGQGSWVGYGDMPPHPCAWSKLRLGWVDAIEVGADRKIALGAVERSAQVVKILAKGPEAPGEYFLIENRRRIGADRSLPGEGLLVWHVDESLTSFRRSQDEVDHKRLDLLTADSWPSHLDRGVSHGGNRGDAGDPWSARREGPGPDTAPSTRAYDGTPGSFAIRNISRADDVMTFEIVFTAAGEGASGGAGSATTTSPAPATTR
ncbi:MAG TPA: M6 family metalloprotease domain-containing protein [Candidatus Binatia bacterium]|nr:M6 family metalloprotease domain-containing protein [Candidatus Binatia bacterium]